MTPGPRPGPIGWIDLTVPNASAVRALQRSEAGAGKLFKPLKCAGDRSRFCTTQDQAGAIAALYESQTQPE
jgi:hypothetical protein